MAKSEAHGTNAVAIFLRMVDAVRRGDMMIPRSGNDKEYFAQDWFSARLTEAQVKFEQQGRNSYPDFLVLSPDPPEGYKDPPIRARRSGVVYPSRGAC